MPSRPPGRPQATDPHAIKVSLRLTEWEADLLQRLSHGDSRSVAIRKALTHYFRLMGGPSQLPHTEESLIRREVRKAKRADTPEARELVKLFGLEEPSEAQRIHDQHQQARAFRLEQVAEDARRKHDQQQQQEARRREREAEEMQRVMDHHQQVRASRLEQAAEKKRQQEATKPQRSSPSPALPRIFPGRPEDEER